MSAAVGADRLQALLRWLAADLGTAAGQCPSNAAIAERLGLSSSHKATSLISRAQAAGLIEFTAPRTYSERAIRVLPAGFELVRQRAPGSAVPRFSEWLEDARPGDRFAYFVGHLAEARGVPPEQHGIAMRLALAQAAAADQAAEAGLVLLTTQRRPDGQCAYLAIRRRAA